MLSYSTCINRKPSTHEPGTHEAFNKWILKYWRNKWINGCLFTYLNNKKFDLVEC